MKVPTDPCWPSDDEWSSFNKSIDGNLVASVPPAIVCYPGPAYDETLCNKTLDSWFDSNFHAANPISIDSPLWANNSCNPIFENGTSVTGDPGAGDRGCTIGAYPVYAVNATDADVISTAVKFAGEKNIRLVVKNTGHSFTGRSTGYGSLSIWMHNLKSFSFHQQWTPNNCSARSATTSQMAATFGGGIQDREAYALSHEHGAVVSAGSNPSVGLAGWFPSGGHGPLSSSYGMGADNLLEAKVVLPNGDIVIANECHHSDLFWALRGGGAGTFGVIVEATVKAFPSPRTTISSLSIRPLAENITNLTSQWWDTAAHIHAELPAIKDGGAQGYYSIIIPPAAPAHTFTFFAYHYDSSNETVTALWKNVTDLLRDRADVVTYTFETFTTPTFFDLWNATTGAAFEGVAGGGSWLTSRLLSRRALTESVDEVAQAFQSAGPILIGHFIANDKNQDLDIALNPSWRNAVTHLIAATGWDDKDPPSVQEERLDYLRNVQAHALKQLDPEAGAYINEVRHPSSGCTVKPILIALLRPTHSKRIGNIHISERTIPSCEASRRSMIRMV